MNLDDIKDRLKSEWHQTQERLEENSTYNAIKDRYGSLSPLMQKVVAWSIALVLSLLVLSFPIGHYQTSNENLTEFESTRALMKDLLKVQKEIHETPEIPVPPAPDVVKSRVESDLQGAKLLPEQILGVQILHPHKADYIAPTQNEGMIEVSLGQLNVRQLTDLGSQFQNISPSVKLKDLVVNASTKDPRYFDVIYRLLVLKVLPEEVPAAEMPPTKKGRK